MNAYIIPGIRGAKLPVNLFLNRTTAERVVRATCDVLNVDINDLIGKTRKKEVVEARHIISFILVKRVGLTLKTVGQLYLGGRDHTTIINSLKKFDNLYDTEESFRDKVYTITGNIRFVR